MLQHRKGTGVQVPPRGSPSPSIPQTMLPSLRFALLFAQQGFNPCFLRMVGGEGRGTFDLWGELGSLILSQHQPQFILLLSSCGNLYLSPEK